MFLQGILKITLRNLKKNKVPTIIKILGLSVSISAAIIIWSYVINENKFDKGIPDSDRIYRLEAQWANMPAFIGDAINKNMANQVIGTRLNFWGDIGIQINNIPFNIKDLTFADSSFFKVFKLPFIEGTPDDALLLPFSLVLSESFSKKLFGDIDPVGKTVKILNQFDFTVTAIIKDQPYLHFKTDIIASLASFEQLRYKGVLKEFDGWSYPTYLILPEGISKEASEKTLMEMIKNAGYSQQFTIRPFPQIYFYREVENETIIKHGNLLYNKILISVSIFILLLAAINFINLTIANAVSRSKEVSMKKIQGATVSNLVMQFMFETVLFIFLSIGLSFLLIWFLNPTLYLLTGFHITCGQLVSSHNLTIAIIGIVTFIFITGIYPSLYISSYTINTKKDSSSRHSNHGGIRNFLVIFQNVVSITLICCTLIANKQFSYMNKMDLGFDKENILNLKMNSQLTGHIDLFREKLLRYPEIISLSYSNRLPGNYWGSWCCVNIEGNENKYFNNYVDPDYLKTMDISISEGRNFSSDNQADIKSTYLINETAIKKYGLKNPLGQVITPGNGIKGEIIGIFKDFHYRGLNYELTPLILFYNMDYINYINIRINGNNVDGALERIKAVWDEMCPAFAFEYTFLAETYDLQYKSERQFENLIFSFALLAIFIAGIGLFGLSVFSTAARTKEIGLRKVNGARVKEILMMLNTDFIRFVAIAWLISCPVAWYVMKKWLMNFAYRTELSWWVFASAGLIAFGVAVLTVSWQSWRAATRNPVEALRYE